MMTRLFFCFQIVGGVVCVVSGSVGAVLLLVWLADVALTRVLRATKTFGIVIRYAWLEGNKKQQLKDDLSQKKSAKGSFRRPSPYQRPMTSSMSRAGFTPTTGRPSTGKTRARKRARRPLRRPAITSSGTMT